MQSLANHRLLKLYHFLKTFLGKLDFSRQLLWHFFNSDAIFLLTSFAFGNVKALLLYHFYINYMCYTFLLLLLLEVFTCVFLVARYDCAAPVCSVLYFFNHFT